MYDFLIQNLSTIIISLLLSAAVFAIIASKISARKKGTGGCSCGCNGCAMSKYCHNTEKDTDKEPAAETEEGSSR